MGGTEKLAVYKLSQLHKVVGAVSVGQVRGSPLYLDW